MTKTYTQIVKQIEALKLEAEKLRKQEVDGVVKTIRQAIQAYNLSSADLGFVDGKFAAPVKGKAAAKGKPAKTAKAAKSPPVVKYRNEAGQSWGGIGKRPRWLQEAIAAGRALEDFAVK